MKQRNPWLTIIIPIYNAEQYLHKCLDSIVSQSFVNYEVIMVDDGSTDNSPEICKEYSAKDKRFQYYRTENHGVLAARIHGAKFVNGEYFTYCDSDDWYANNKVFQLLFDKVSATVEDVSVVQFGFFKKYNHIKRKIQLTKQDCIVNANEFYLNEYPKLLCSFWDSSHLTMSVWNKLYKHELLQYLPAQSEKVFWGEDLILNLHLLQSITSAYFLSDVIYIYQQTTGDTNRFSVHTMNDLDIIKKYQLKFLSKRAGDDMESIEQILYSEIAGWFIYYLKDAVKYLNDDELKKLIANSLSLPRFKSAIQFYKKYPEEWEGAVLLRKADEKEYFESAKMPEKLNIKAVLIKVFGDIIKKI